MVWLTAGKLQDLIFLLPFIMTAIIKLMDRGRIPGGITKRIKISAAVCLALILCQGCGGFLMKKQAKQELPLDKKLTITKYEIDE